MTHGEDSANGLPKIIVYGAGGYGKEVADIIEKTGRYVLAGFVDDRVSGTVMGYPVLGGKDSLASIRTSGVEYAVSAVGNPDLREKLDGGLLAAGFKLAVAVHPSASVAKGVELGEGTVVAPGAVIGPDTKIGRSCIINPSCSVGHDCRIGNNSHIGPGAVLCGGVSVGDRTLIGAGAVVIPGVRVGSRCTVGAGSTAIMDVPDGTTVVGVPARQIHFRGDGK